MEEEEYDPDTIQKPEDVPNAFVVQIQTEDGVCLSSTDAFQWGADTAGSEQYTVETQNGSKVLQSKTNRRWKESYILSKDQI